jgi:arsenite methyltransferase
MRKKNIERSETVRERADYGIDAPYVLLALTASGLICLVLGLASPALRWLFSPTISLLATSAVWLYGSKVGKLRLRETLMDTLHWNGKERVLDVGCGSGLLLVAAAKRLNGGTAVGVDIWRKEDLANNRLETTLRNARIEGVADRIQVEEGDARMLPFGEAIFDVVVSLNVIHNIAKREERAQALKEIVRVLKPGGRLVIADFRNIGDYVMVLHTSGIGDVHKQLLGWVGLFPMFAAIGRKPLD